ncbi:MAG: SDR family oxidoreductase, partial [Parvibaculaceae bacterium]
GAGHSVVAGVRDPEKFARRFPAIEARACDFNRLLDPTGWAPLVRGCDAVVNCAGVLQTRRGDDATAIHEQGPRALFQAAEAAGVRRVVQVSAVSVGADTEYARSKLGGDSALMALDLDWIVLRPSLVYGRMAWGGTALLRSLAAMPFVSPVPGDGRQAFQPVHVSDVCETVVWALDSPDAPRHIVEPCGPETASLRDVIARYRGWLGLKPAPVLEMPLPLVRLASRLGDVFGTGALTSTSLAQIEFGNASDPHAFTQATGIRPRAMAEALAQEPAGPAELWQARLLLLRPLVRAALALLWLISGVLGLFATEELARHVGPALAPWLAASSGAWDILLALLVAFSLRPRLAFWLQFGSVLAYTAALTLTEPALWLDLYGPVLKNLPILALILVHRVLEEER